MKYSQLIAIAALMNVTVAEVFPHQKHPFAHDSLKNLNKLAQLEEEPKKAIADPIVQEKKDKVAAINEEIEKKENPEVSAEDAEKEAKKKLDETVNEGVISAAKGNIKKLEESKEKRLKEAEDEGKKPDAKAIEVIDKQIVKAEATIEATPKKETNVEEKETKAEIAALKVKKEAAVKEVEKEQVVIDKVKAKIDAMVNPKEEEKPVQTKGEKSKADIKGYMDKIKKEDEAAEAAKEEREAAM
jgi:hypothetical protein